jgi:hypothetical protein
MVQHAVYYCLKLLVLLVSVVDRHRVHADAPGPPDPDPTFNFDNDPDPDPTPIFTHVGKKSYFCSQHFESEKSASKVS